MAQKINAQKARTGLKDLEILGFLATGNLTVDSSTGRVFWKSVEMSQFADHSGYLRVILSQFKRIFRFRVHRIILIAELGLPPEGMEAMHIDADKSNNCISNLRWGSHSENMQAVWASGERVYASFESITFEQGREIRERWLAGESKNSLASAFGRDFNTIRKVVESPAEQREYYYKLESPDGVIYEGWNLKQFCREHNLSYFMFNDHKLGKTKKMGNGWKILSGKQEFKGKKKKCQIEHK